MIRSFFLPVILLLFAGIADFTPIKNIPGQEHRGYAGRRIVSCAPGGYVPFDYLNSPIAMKEGIGEMDFPVAGASPSVQAWFNQGEAFLYNFEYVQAARSFYAAWREDSSLAMVSWGLSQAHQSLDDSTEARRFAERAMELAAMASPAEQVLIRMQYFVTRPAHDSASYRQRHDLLQQLSDSAIRLYPRDAEILVFSGMLRSFGYIGPMDESELDAQKAATNLYLMKGLEVNPRHFGIWHLLIHQNESLSDFTTALQYGRMYTTSSPNIPHAWHMLAHDLMKTGQVSAAIANFNHAFELENKKYIAEKMPRKYDWHHAHNLELLAYCYQYKGRFAEAEKIFFVLDTLSPTVDDRVAQIRKGHPYYYLQVNQPVKARALAAPLIASKHYSSQFTGYFINGLAGVFLKDTAAALAGYASMIHIVDSLRDETIRKGRPADQAADDYSYMYARAAIIRMGARMLVDPADPDVVKQMESIQKTLLKQTGPDPWIDGLYFLQLLAQMSLNAGNLPLAETSANNMLKHDPGYPGAFLLMAKVKNAQGNTSEAKQWIARAKEGYREADPVFLKGLKL
ncbi:MAG: hypothetical protein EOO09_11000 [Chitinophagaceae bacterium]|nr:MAG: hypothetical protein EOO09_11000 [Chitinophagaceae bacterium]